MKIIKPISTTIIIYLLLSAGFYLFQNLFFFHPKKLALNYTFKLTTPFAEFNLKQTDGSNINGIHFLNSDSANGVVVFYHGNQDNMEHYFLYNKFFAKNNFNCIMVDYPGYGKSTGTITQKSFREIAISTYDYAHKIYAGKKMVIYGKSLGTGIAAYAASQKPCSFLFLETPYFSLNSLAQQYAIGFNAKWLTRYKLNSYQFIQQTKAPIVAMVTNTDKVIPYQNSIQLLNYLKPTDKFITVLGATHNSLPSYEIYEKTIDSLLNSY